MRNSLFVLPVLALSLSACGGGGGGGDSNPADAGSPRNFTRSDGAVTSSCNVLTNSCTATQVVTISNDDAGASRGVVSLTSDSADITSSANASGYNIQVTFTATAPTDAGARQALATMSVSHRDATGPGVLYLDNHVSVPNYNASNTTRSATVVAALPQSLSYQLAQQDGSGNIATSGLTGTSADFDCGSGNTTLGGTWDSASATTGSGNVTVTADAPSLYMASGSGTLTATLPSLRATQATLTTGSGVVDVTVSHAGNGVFDADAQTDSGTASVVIAGTSAYGAQTSTHAHYRSSNYDSANPKIAVSSQSGSGTNTIHD